MSLTDDQFIRLRQHLDTRTKRSCPLCDTQDWEVYSHVPLPLSPLPSAHVFGAKALPCVALVCKHCGNTVLVNLVVAGVLPPHG